MENLIVEFESRVHALIQEKLLLRMEKEIDEELEAFLKLQQELNTIYDHQIQEEAELATLRSQTLNSIAQVWNPSQGEPFSTYATDFNDHLIAEIDKLPAEVTRIQDEDRFRPTASDKGLLRVRKRLKNGLFRFSQIPNSVLNLFRANKITPTRWSHLVPLHGIANHLLRVKLEEALRTKRDKFYVELSQSYQLIKAWEEGIMVGSTTELAKFDVHLAEAIATAKIQLREEIAELCKTIFQEIRDCSKTVNTIEHSSKKYAKGTYLEAIEKEESAWQKYDRDWHHAFDAMFEEWRSDLEISCLISGVKADLQSYKSTQISKLSDFIGPEIDAILDFIRLTKQEVEEENKELSAILRKAYYQAKKSLDKEIIPTLVEKLSGKHIVNSIANLESNLNKALNKLTTERKISKHPSDYLSPIESSEMTTISPYELIAFEIAPALQTKIDKVKSGLIGELDGNITVSKDLDHMISFGLNAALDHLKSHPDQTQETQALALDSLQRSEQRVKEIQDSLSSAIDLSSKNLTEVLTGYTDSLLILMENENVREIRMRIVKAKALKQTEAYKQELKNKAKNRWNNLLILVQEGFKNFNTLIQETRQRFILTAKKEAASKETSDFLSTSQEAIDSLPVIYRNLYRIEPLTDLELFVGRQTELDQLFKAYKNWETGKTGSCVIIGEKWGGLTTFINYLQHASLFKHAINRKACETQEDNSQQVIAYFMGLLEQTECDIETIAAGLNEGPKRIIIFEDIQNLYLKKVGGFVGIKMLLEIISKTSKNIFWITTSTKYAYGFFRRTFNIQGVFSYSIELLKPTTQEVVKLIEKRNRISGYRIIFQSSEEDEKSKKFVHLPEEQQQKILEERFFKKLIDFSESNVSMALMFWLLSTVSVDRNQIIIGGFRKPDLSFLSTLSQDKILGLHQLILHDGMSIDSFIAVSNIGKQAAFFNLSMMREDGILTLKGDQYLINPLVYRSVITLLKAKNLIY